LQDENQIPNLVEAATPQRCARLRAIAIDLTSQEPHGRCSFAAAGRAIASCSNQFVAMVKIGSTNRQIAHLLDYRKAP
jgi:hypothetical protein